jgi:hypothetical protein
MAPLPGDFPFMLHSPLGPGNHPSPTFCTHATPHINTRWVKAGLSALIMAKFAQNPGEAGGGRVGTADNCCHVLQQLRVIYWHDFSVANRSESGG